MFRLPVPSYYPVIELTTMPVQNLFLCVFSNCKFGLFELLNMTQQEPKL